MNNELGKMRQLQTALLAKDRCCNQSCKQSRNCTLRVKAPPTPVHEKVLYVIALVVVWLVIL